LEEQLERIGSGFQPIHFVAGEIAMIRRSDMNDPFQVDRLIPLGG
jgi:hypothetical protein